MAVRDVKEYYLAIEKSYFDTKKVADELNKELQAGNVTEEQAAQAMQLTQTILNNYNRLAYVMFLLNKPRRKSNQVRFNEANRTLKAYFSENGADSQAIDLENIDALKGLKQLLEQIKEQK